jgi:lipopolysaccharide biosynthesis glycosyltransferase
MNLGFAISVPTVLTTLQQWESYNININNNNKEKELTKEEQEEKENTFTKMLITTLYSIKKSNPNNFFNIYIVYHNFSSRNRTIIKDYIEKSKMGKCHFEYIEVELEFPHFYKLFFFQRFRDIDKLLYLDFDILVNKDLTELYNTNIDDYYLAGFTFLEIIGDMKKAHDIIGCKENIWFTGGIILINLKKVRNDKKDIEITDIKNIQHSIKAEKEVGALFFDEFSINKVFEGNMKSLKEKFDFIRDKRMPNFNKTIIHYYGWSRNMFPFEIKTKKDYIYKFIANHLSLTMIKFLAVVLGLAIRKVYFTTMSFYWKFKVKAMNDLQVLTGERL